MLRQSLHTMLMAPEMDDSGVLHDHMDSIAKRHSRNERDIRPELYDLWLECLLQAVDEHDPLFSHELKESWRASMTHGIDYIRSQY